LSQTGKNRGRDRKQALSMRALKDLALWLGDTAQQSPAEVSAKTG